MFQIIKHISSLSKNGSTKYKNSLYVKEIEDLSDLALVERIPAASFYLDLYQTLTWPL